MFGKLMCPICRNELKVAKKHCFTCSKCSYKVNSTEHYTIDLQNSTSIDFNLLMNLMHKPMQTQYMNIKKYSDDDLYVALAITEPLVDDNSIKLIEELYKHNKFRALEEFCKVAKRKNKNCLKRFLAEKYFDNYDLVAYVAGVIQETVGVVLEYILEYISVEQLKEFIFQETVTYKQWSEAVSTCCRKDLPKHLEVLMKTRLLGSPISLADAIISNSRSCLEVLLDLDMPIDLQSLSYISPATSTECLELLLEKLQLENLNIGQLTKLAVTCSELKIVSDQHLRDMLISFLKNHKPEEPSKIRCL